jgi:SAM-dependent methyltransferase
MTDRPVYVKCNLCGWDENRAILKVGQDRIYVACSRCRLVFRNPSPPDEQVHEFYRNGDLPSSGAGIEAYRQKLYQGLLSKLEKLGTEHRRLLDIGSGYGGFLAIARDRGWEVSGVELSRAACDYVTERYGLPVYQGDLMEADLPSRYFDVVTMWNILDHLPNPFEQLVEVRRVLKPGGVLFVRIPNFLFQRINFSLGCLIDKLLPLGNAAVAHRISIFHLYCFTSTTLRRMLRKAGFSRTRILNSRPSVGDPYSGFAPRSETIIHIGKSLLYLVSQGVFLASGGTMTVAPSLEAYVMP